LDQDVGEQEELAEMDAQSPGLLSVEEAGRSGGGGRGKEGLEARIANRRRTANSN